MNNWGRGKQYASVAHPDLSLWLSVTKMRGPSPICTLAQPTWSIDNTVMFLPPYPICEYRTTWGKVCCR